MDSPKQDKLPVAKSILVGVGLVAFLAVFIALYAALGPMVRQWLAP